jgi:uncharacterized protein with HEPN domain
MMKPISWLEELLATLPPVLEELPKGDPDLWHFDPDRDSLADVIEALEIDCRDQAENWGEETREFYEWKADGLAWLRIAVGLNFKDLQARWREIDVIHVEKRISERYSLDDPRGLFVYLNQIIMAYVVGADLAAIAMCRATTELLIRRHYAPCADEEAKLHSLIRGVQARPKFKFLKDQDLRGKVKEADGILHNRALGDNVREFPARYRVLVRDWVKLLEKMINEAPENSPVSLPSPVLRLTHIVDAIERIRSETASVPLVAFEADWRKRWLVERGVEIIAEASLHLSEELKARHPKIPWPKVAGIGDVLRDGYEHVAPKVLWNIAMDCLGPLERACREELAAAGA